MDENEIPVIAIDGPSGSGKGTISRLIAQRLGWHMLDSGALYRLVALAAQRHSISMENKSALVPLAAHLDVEFHPGEGSDNVKIILEGEEVTNDIRTEECGNAASKVAALPAVREALLERQRAFRMPPGLVADGRDMGTVVFPEAKLKIFLTASQEERADRRYKQLKEKGINVSFAQLLKEIAARDERDSNRKSAPLKAATDADYLDTSNMTIDEVVDYILEACRRHGMCI
jgi:cytidylate kinase